MHGAQWTLDAYGLDFPETLMTLYPDDPEIVELACLERELGAAFVGPDSPQLDPAALADIDWDSAIIHFVPTFRFLTVTTNVVAIWSAINAHEAPPSAARLSESATVAIWRDHLSPRFRTLTPEEVTVLRQLREGRTFGAVCADLVDHLDEERGPAIAGALLGQWFSDHMIARIGH